MIFNDYNIKKDILIMKFIIYSYIFYNHIAQKVHQEELWYVSYI